jgi:hypothetical protein
VGRLPFSLPHSGILFLLGTYPKSPDRSAAIRKAKRGTLGRKGRARREQPRDATDESQSRESGIQRHDHVPVFSNTQ